MIERGGKLVLELLGMPIVHVGDQRVTPPTRKGLALLAYLAIEGPAPRARLAQVLWPSIAPEAARGNLRRELNRLRHTPLGDEIFADGDAIVLRQPVRCDVKRFVELADAREVGAALALYRGPLLDGLELFDADGFDDWLARKRASYQDRYRAALAREAEAREAAGDARGALQMYLDLIRLDETKETYFRNAMRLHDAVGEREAALECFARLKRVLRRELALDPLPETLEVYRSIRAAKPARVVRAPERTAVSIEPSLVGRSADWAALESAVATPLVVVLAEAGVGKTRLASDFARASGSYLVARASELSRLTPLYPFAAALEEALGNAEMARRIGELKPAWRREAARLVPGIDPDAPADSLPGEARSRLLEGLARALAAAVGARGLLVLDDLQWFDAASTELAMHIVRRARALDVRIIATARPSELRASPASQLVDAALREGLGTSHSLGPLREGDVLAFVRATSRAIDAATFAGWLYRLTDGNAAFLVEAVKSLVASGDLDVDGARIVGKPGCDYATLPLPGGVREAVLRRVDRLGPAALRLLEAASLTGSEFTLDDLDGATGLGPFEAVDALERATDAGLLKRDARGTSFHHELVRRAFADALSDERRKLLHCKLAESLVRRGGAAVLVADHYAAAGRAADAVAFRIRAAEDALRIFAFQEALDQCQAVLDAAPTRERVLEARERRVRVYRMLDDRRAWKAEVDALEAIARDDASPALRSRVFLLRAELENAVGSYREALEHADAAGAEPDAAVEGARALLNLGRAGDARARLLAALEVAGERDAHTTSQIHRTLYACAIDQNDLAAARAHNEDARACDRACADRYGLVLARMNDGTICRRETDVPRAIEHLGVALADARELGFVSLERLALLALASAHNALGEYDRAADLAEQGIELAREPEDPMLEARFAQALAAFEYARGNLGSSIARSEHAVDVAMRLDAASWTVLFRCSLAHTLLELGAAAGARHGLDAARITIDAHGIVTHHVLVETHLAHLDLLSDDAAAAVARLERALESGAPPSLDADYTFAVLGRAKLRSGDADGALSALGRHEFRPLHRSRALAVRIEAKVALGRDPREDVAEALALLDDPGLSPVESLELRRSLVGVLPAKERTAHLAAARALVDRLARSLGDRSEVVGCFVALNRDLAQ
jgi:DNA-binding SARP family transcriptional activator